MYQELFMDQQQEEPRDNPMGLASMVTGILSLLTGCCPFSGFFFGGLAVLFAALSKVEFRLWGTDFGKRRPGVVAASDFLTGGVL